MHIICLTGIVKMCSISCLFLILCLPILVLKGLMNVLLDISCVRCYSHWLIAFWGYSYIWYPGNRFRYWEFFNNIAFYHVFNDFISTLLGIIRNSSFWFNFRFYFKFDLQFYLMFFQLTKPLKAMWIFTQYFLKFIFSWKSIFITWNNFSTGLKSITPSFLDDQPDKTGSQEQSII